MQIESFTLVLNCGFNELICGTFVRPHFSFHLQISAFRKLPVIPDHRCRTMASCHLEMMARAIPK